MDQMMPVQGGSPAAGSGMGTNPRQASDEEQALLDKTVAKAYEIIYEMKTAPAFLQTLQGNGNPDRGLALATTQTIATVAQAAERAGQTLPGNVLFAAGKEVIEDLADLSAEAGIKDYSKEQDALDGAFFQAVDDFRIMMSQNGRIDQKAYQQDLNQLQQMDGSGKLEQVLRGLAASDGSPGGQAREADAPF